MNAIVRSFVLLAVVGHVGLSVAYASTGASADGPRADAGRTADLARAERGLTQLAQATGGSAGGSTGGSTGGSAGGATGGSTGGDGGGSTGGGSTGGGGHGGGAPFSNPSYGAASTATAGSCSTGMLLSDPDAFGSPLAGLAAISKQTQTYIEQCECRTQGCIADALDTYANAIAKVTPRLPRAARTALRDLPTVVHAAAARARAASTVREAVAVLHETVAIVHKTVALMRAADPDARRVATRGGDLVAHTLDTAASSLERADTL